MSKMTPKKAMEKMEKTETAWQTLAPEAKFYNVTLAQYKAKVQQSREARAAIAALEQQLTAAIDLRDDLDAETLVLEGNIVKAIAGDPEYGDDSALYEGVGRVRRSERKSGLTRKRRNPNADQ